MTGRTLEEIAAEWREAEGNPIHPMQEAQCGEANMADLLAIAQGQREEIATLRTVHDAAEAIRTGATRPFGLALEHLRDASESASKAIGTKK